MFTPLVAEISAIIFIATTFRTTFGFGEALISVPLLALFLPMQAAAPIAVFASIIVAAVSVILDWRHIQFRGASRLIISTLFGLPAGILILKIAPEGIIKGILAGVLILFSGYSLLSSNRFSLADDRFAWIFGVCAGLCGGSYGMNGPPLAIYGSLRRWPPEKFRATLQAYFLVASSLAMCGYWLSGFCSAKENHFFLWALAPACGGILLGRQIGRQSGERFYRLLHIFLLLIAFGLLAECCLNYKLH